MENFNSSLLEIGRFKSINRKEMIPVILKLVRDIASMKKFTEKEIMQLELVVEESAMAIIENSFDAGETGYFDVAFTNQPNKFIISLEDKGLPFEISQLEGEEVGALRLLLMKAFADEIQFHNLGREGKKIEIIKNVPNSDINEYAQSEVILDRNAEIDTREVHFKIMDKSNALDLSRCVYRSYGLSYRSDYIYFPEKIAELLESGLMRSCVGINADGQVVSHLALNFITTKSKVGETGQAVVDPRYRGRGLFEKMKKYLAEYSKDVGDYGFYSESVSIHPFTQKGNLALGAHETGILLGYVPEGVQFKKIQGGEQSVRQTTVLFYMKINQEPHRKAYLPEKHSDMLKKIFEINNLDREICEAENYDLNELSEVSQFDLKVRPEWGFAFLVIHQFGKDIYEQIKYHLINLKLQKIECIYLDMPISDKWTSYFNKSFESLGFFFSGIIPELYEGDTYRLQYLNNVRIDKDKIYAVSDFAKELLDYTLVEMDNSIKYD